MTDQTASRPTLHKSTRLFSCSSCVHQRFITTYTGLYDRFNKIIQTQLWSMKRPTGIITDDIHVDITNTSLASSTDENQETTLILSPHSHHSHTASPPLTSPQLPPTIVQPTIMSPPIVEPTTIMSPPIVQPTIITPAIVPMPTMLAHKLNTCHMEVIRIQIPVMKMNMRKGNPVLVQL